MTHTPGPWEIRRALTPEDGEYNFGIGAAIDGRKHCIAEAFGRVDTNVTPNAQANARLIAAAPDIFKALETTINYAAGLEDECERLGNPAPKSPHNVTLTKARDALAKAKGD